MVFWGVLSPNDVAYRFNRKGLSLCEYTSLEPQSVKIGPAVRPVHVPEKTKRRNRTGQSKSQEGAIIINGETPVEPVYIKICVAVFVQT